MPSDVRTSPAYQADYGASKRTAAGEQAFLGGAVLAVRPESPADDAGILPGMYISSVNGAPLTDMIVWLWESDEDVVELEVFDPRDNTREKTTLERLPGEDWGLTFTDAVFDGMRTCVNACIFCFMTMLPPNARNSLSVRDDDYRLSFLQGNFVTLTNMTDEDVANVIEKKLSPMNVSIHAITPAVRRRLMGKNEGRGMEVLNKLMAADIEIHAQVVLCPGINDGPELAATLSFCEKHPQITSLGIVPLGFTKHQKRFSSSFSSDAKAARSVIEQVRPYQARAFERFGRHTFQMSDEFYLDAHMDPPPAEFYDGYPQYYDGIGMIRAYLDETAEMLGQEQARLQLVSDALQAHKLSLSVISGVAAQKTVERFVSARPLEGSVFAIQNYYFGGNVDVTGLICGCDLLEQLPSQLSGHMVILPDVMFNADGLTLDGYHQKRLIELLEKRDACVFVAPTMPRALLCSLEAKLDIVR